MNTIILTTRVAKTKHLNKLLIRDLLLVIDNLKEIAYFLNISYETVKAHRRNLGFAVSLTTRRKRREGVCEACGVSFYKEKLTRKFCSHKCSNSHTGAKNHKATLALGCRVQGCCRPSVYTNACEAHYRSSLRAFHKLKLMEIK